LKEIILVVQQKAVQLKVNSEPGQDEQASDDATEKASADSTKNKGLEGLPTRVRFMIETIYDLKNNKTRYVLMFLPPLPRATHLALFFTNKESQ